MGNEIKIKRSEKFQNTYSIYTSKWLELCAVGAIRDNVCWKRNKRHLLEAQKTLATKKVESQTNEKYRRSLQTPTKLQELPDLRCAS